MGTVKYGDVDEMVATLPRDERVVANRLRALIAECVPKAEEKAYYGLGVPFYRHNKLICFIWPPSVYWDPRGKKSDKRNPRGTSLGFCQGYLMSNEDGALLAEGRKQVYVLYVKSLNDIDENQIRTLLFEAAMIDESFKKKKKRNLVDYDQLSLRIVSGSDFQKPMRTSRTSCSVFLP